MTDAATIFHIESPHAIRNLKKRLTALIEAKSAMLATGVAKDFADYQKRIGTLDGLREALALCEEMAKDER